MVDYCLLRQAFPYGAGCSGVEPLLDEAALGEGDGFAVTNDEMVEHSDFDKG